MFRIVAAGAPPWARSRVIAAPTLRSWPLLAAGCSLQLADERVCKCEKQRDANTDHRNGIEQCNNDKHFRLQHGRQFGLTCGTFKKAATQKAHTDTDAQCAEANQKCGPEASQSGYEK